MQGGDYAKFKHVAVLEIIIIIYSQEICPFNLPFGQTFYKLDWTKFIDYYGMPEGQHVCICLLNIPYSFFEEQ